MSWPLLLAWLPAQADPGMVCAALDPLTMPLCEQALSHEQAERWNKAAASWRLLHESNPSFERATMGLARAREQQGMEAEAEVLYRSLGMHSDAMMATAKLIEAERPREAMAIYHQLQSLRLGEPGPYLDESRAALAAGELELCEQRLEEYLPKDGATQLLAAAQIMRGLAEALPEQEREQSRAWLERSLELDDQSPEAQSTRERLDRMSVEDSATSLAVGGGEALDPEEQAALESIRMDMAGGRMEQAQEAMQRLLEQTPRSPEAWGTQGDLHLELGLIAAAETAWLTAITLEPEEPTWRVRYGRLLAERYGGRRASQARAQLERALTQRPGWTELHLEIAQLYAAQGEFEAAQEACAHYLLVAPQGELAERALRCVEDLDREPPPAPDLRQLLARPPEGVPEPAWEAFKRAKVYLEDRDDDTAARAEVDQSLAIAPDYVDALNLLAHLQLRQPDLEAALQTYKLSLDRRPNQPQIVLAVGYSLQDLGEHEEAARRFEQAAELGAQDAWFALAQLAAGQGQWLEARKLLGRYFSLASGGQNHERAEQLQAHIETQLAARGAAGGAALLLGLGLPSAWLLRRRSGATLRELLRAHPESYREAVALLAALRHEVLKHNTTVLPAAAKALREQRDAPVIEAFDHLLGRGTEGVCPRFWRYLGELEALGLRYEMRLNLRRRDPVIAPMVAAFERLEKVGAQLGPEQISGDRERAARSLEQLSVALNQEAYRALGALISQVCVLPLSQPLLRACWRSVADERRALESPTLPSFVLSMEEPSVPIRMFQRELQDLVVNLLRNALEASLEERGDKARVGLFVEVEADPITGLERVALAVADNALSKLSDELIHGRYIARGLGIVVELVRQNAGQIQVQPWPGYEKAIVVRLPRAELPEVMVEVEEEP